VQSFSKRFAHVKIVQKPTIFVFRFKINALR
jgi:hypothetical protein